MMGTVYVPPLEERVLTAESLRVLEVIAQKQKSHLVAHLHHINRKMKYFRDRQMHPATQMLECCGYIELVKRVEVAGLGQNKGYKLTDKGWEVIGGKPIWM